MRDGEPVQKSQPTKPPQPPPVAEFGTVTPLIVGNRRYMVVAPQGTYKSGQQDNNNGKEKSNTNNKNEQKKANEKNNKNEKTIKDNEPIINHAIPHSLSNNNNNTTTPPTIMSMLPNYTKSTTDFSVDFTPIDPNTNKERTSIHGIPIIFNPTTKNYTIMYTFPSILSPALTSVYDTITLPKPTPGGSIQLLLSNETIDGLCKVYEKYFTIIMEARLLHPPTHFFGVPLGPVHPMCYDLDNPTNITTPYSKNNDDNNNNNDDTNLLTKRFRWIDSIDHYNDENVDKSKWRFHTKFMQSETAQLLALNIVKMYKTMGLKCDNALDMVVMKHDNYNNNNDNKNKNKEKTNNEGGKNNDDDFDDITDETAYQAKLHYEARMPIPKLHTTMFILRILSADELISTIHILKTIQQVIYDAIGGTSISLRVKDVIPWNMVNDKIKNEKRAKHYVAELIEIAKDGKINAGDHLPVYNDDDNTQSNNDTNNNAATKTDNISGTTTQTTTNGDNNNNDSTISSSTLTIPSFFPQNPTNKSSTQRCPRLALITGIVAHSLLKIGVMTPHEIKREKIGTAVGQQCGVNWHMTLFNSKYAQRFITRYHEKQQQQQQQQQQSKSHKTHSLNFNEISIGADLCNKGANSIRDWGQHRLPCVNLYRMSSKLHYSTPKGDKIGPASGGKMYFDTSINLYDTLPPRNLIKEHYTIDYTMPMP